MNFLISFLPLGCADVSRMIVTRATSEHDARATFARATECFPCDVIGCKRVFPSDVMTSRDASNYDAWGTLNARNDAYDPVPLSPFPVIVVRSIPVRHM